MDTANEWTPLSGLFPSVSTWNKKSTPKCCHVVMAHTYPCPFSGLHNPSTFGPWISYGHVKGAYHYSMSFKAHAYLFLTPLPSLHTHTGHRHGEGKSQSWYEALILQVNQSRKSSGDLIEPEKPMDVWEESQEEKSSWLGICLTLWTPAGTRVYSLGFGVDQDGNGWQMELGEEATAILSWGHTSIN